MQFLFIQWKNRIICTFVDVEQWRMETCTLMINRIFGRGWSEFRWVICMRILNMKKVSSVHSAHSSKNTSSALSSGGPLAICRIEKDKIGFIFNSSHSTSECRFEWTHYGKPKTAPQFSLTLASSKNAFDVCVRVCIFFVAFFLLLFVGKCLWNLLTWFASNLINWYVIE